MAGSMSGSSAEFLKGKLDAGNYQKLASINNDSLFAFVADAVDLCLPETVWVSSYSADDVEHTRKMAMESRE